MNDLQSTIPNNILLTIKSYISSSVARNALSLYLIQFANYILPLITVPYVVRVLTPSGYGLVAFGQSFVAYFDLFIDYGFSLSATRKISVARHDPMAVSRIVVNVWAAKLILCLTSFLVLLLLVNVVPTLRQNKILLFIIFGTTLGSLLFPYWLFQGMERMVHIAVINLLVRLMVVAGIFTLIKRPEDYLWYAGLGSLGSITAGMVGMVSAFYLFTLPLIWPSWQEIWQALKEGWVLFLSMASVSLYTLGNAFILGMLTNPTVVGYYSAGEKIMKALLGLIGPIAQAAYPRFAKMAVDSKALALQWSRRMLFLMGGIGLALSIVLFIAAPLIVKIILSSQYERSIMVIRILALLPFLVAVSNVLGIQIMLPFRKDRLFTAILFGAGLVNLLLAFVLTPLWQELGMATAVLVSEVFVTFSMFACLTKYQINPLTCWNKF